MNHKFVANTSAPAICVKCSKDVVAHSEYATCEMCKKFPCVVNVVEDYLMCPACEFGELQAKQELKDNHVSETPEPIARLENERFNAPSNQVENIAKGNGISPLTDLPMGGDEFFNAETMATLELEKKIFSDDTIPQDKKWVFFVEQMQARRGHMQKALVESVALLKEIRSRDASINRSINLLASKLRASEKEKLKIQDINYVPVTPPKKVAARTTVKDKTIIGMAKILFAPRDSNGMIIWEALPSEEREKYLLQAGKIYANNYSTIMAASKIEASVDADATGDKNKGE